MSPIDPDYVDVAERIAAFYERYPDGRLRPTKEWEVKQIGERLFVVYEAAAYRTPDDPLPGVGSAWEPFPGPTAFTRDSELMNAETSAWGRAIVAVGIPSKKIASREEVQARQTQPYGEAPSAPVEPAPRGSGRRVPSSPQMERIKALISEHHVTRLELAGILDQWGMELTEGWLERLNRDQASTMIDTLGRLEKPQVDA